MLSLKGPLLHQNYRQGAAEPLSVSGACPRAGPGSAINKIVPASPGPRGPRHVVALSGHHGDEDLHEARLGPNVLSNVKELRDPKAASWVTATVTRNEAASFDGSVRVIHLSIPNTDVDVLYGRKIKGVIDNPRWVDSYTMPGQFVGVRFPGLDGSARTARRLLSIASTPYESRRDSYQLDASVIEVVVDRCGTQDDQRLADMGPGAQLEVTQVVGRGYSSLLNSVMTIQSAVETGRPLLLIAVGTKGMAPMRAALNWTPVLAHATKHKVSCFYITRSATNAAFISEFDTWREAGMAFTPLYTEMFEVEARSAAPGEPMTATPEQLKEAQEQVLEILDKALFLREGGFSSVAGAKSQDCCVLISGLSGDASAQLAKRLAAKGGGHERMLFCDFF